VKLPPPRRSFGSMLGGMRTERGAVPRPPIREDYRSLLIPSSFCVWPVSVLAHLRKLLLTQPQPPRPKGGARPTDPPQEAPNKVHVDKLKQEIDKLRPWREKTRASS